MKENWTYKKLGEVGEIVTGNTPSTKDEENYSSNDYCFVKPSDICVDRISRIVETEFYVSKTGFQHSRRLPQGSVLTTCIGIIGKVGILQKEATCNQQINAIVPSSIVSSEYLAYAIFGLRSELELMANAPVVPIINKGSFSNFTIPVPPIETQSRIVSELDLLQSIMDKQQAQLKELDKLAQAVFYDMFGDPVENEKGWEVKTMGEVGELQRGSGLSKKDLIEEGFPCMLYGQIHTRFGAYTKKHITCIPKELVKTAKIAHPGDVIMAITSEDVEGSCKSVAWMGDYDIAIGSDAAIYRHNMNGIYVSYYTQTKAFFNEKAKYAKGFKVTHISTKEIATIPILNPPLSLQQSFAAKIESIEKQKTAIGKSIEETRKLFDYTMDKYFG